MARRDSGVKHLSDRAVPTSSSRRIGCRGPSPMSSPEPFTPAEDKLWRAIMRIVTVLPSYLDADLLRGAGLTASEYTVLMSLREAPAVRELRMTDLANAAGLSTSRITRLVDELEKRGIVTKLASPADTQSTRARIAPR